MVTPVFRAADGLVFDTEKEAIEHETSTNIIDDVRKSIVEILREYDGRDDNRWDMLREYDETVSQFADLLVMSDLVSRIIPILKKGKII